MERHVLWEPTDAPGLEHVTVSFADGLDADGLVIGVADRPFRVRYAIRCDERGRVRSMRADSVDDGDDPLVLRADGDGNWTDGGGDPLPSLSGCLDVDISVTPFTNTLPIRRLDLDEGSAAELGVVYLDPPSMAVSAVEQRYTCIEPLGPAGGTVQYESLDSDFRATLSVDPDGLVRDYPELFRRVEW